MTWNTAITKIEAGQIRLRGYDITELMGKMTFAEAAFLALKGERPTKAEGRMMDALLVSSIDHGVTPPSSQAARLIFSGGNPLTAAVAAGGLTIGETHGGAIEQCARILQEIAAKEGEVEALAGALVAEYRASKKRMPGYGHRVHKVDPRTRKLYELAAEVGFAGRHMALAKAIQEKLEADSGKALPLNVDGAIAAVISDMGFDWRLGKGFFIISRTVGLVAHTVEEWTREKPMRQFIIAEHTYDGPEDRSLE
jgi:citrate synthase